LAHGAFLRSPPEMLVSGERVEVAKLAQSQHAYKDTPVGATAEISISYRDDQRVCNCVFGGHELPAEASDRGRPEPGGRNRSVAATRYL
jgi:hypothetical protein